MSLSIHQEINPCSTDSNPSPAGAFQEQLRPDHVDRCKNKGFRHPEVGHNQPYPPSPGLEKRFAETLQGAWGRRPATCSPCLALKSTLLCSKLTFLFGFTACWAEEPAFRNLIPFLTGLSSVGPEPTCRTIPRAYVFVFFFLPGKCKFYVARRLFFSQNQEPMNT